MPDKTKKAEKIDVNSDAEDTGKRNIVHTQIDTVLYERLMMLSIKADIGSRSGVSPVIEKLVAFAEKNLTSFLADDKKKG